MQSTSEVPSSVRLAALLSPQSKPLNLRPHGTQPESTKSAAELKQPRPKTQARTATSTEAGQKEQAANRGKGALSGCAFNGVKNTIKKPQTTGQTRSAKGKTLSKSLAQLLDPISKPAEGRPSSIMSRTLDPTEPPMVIPRVEHSRISSKGLGVVRGFAANTHKGTVRYSRESICREYNEDRVSILLNIAKPGEKPQTADWPVCHMFSIFDGHGGTACADFLRDQLHKFVYLPSF
jgi:hypothetical protein